MSKPVSDTVFEERRAREELPPQVDVAPPGQGAAVVKGGVQYNTFYKDVEHELPTGEKVVYRYWYDPETGEWVMGHKVSGPETRWVYRGGERVGLEYKAGEDAWLTAPAPPVRISVSGEERGFFAEAWKQHLLQRDAERRAREEEEEALSQLKGLAAQLGLETDTSPGALQVKVVQAALEKAGMSPAEAYQTALKFQYADPREVLSFLKGSEVEYGGGRVTLFDWVRLGEKLKGLEERFTKQLEKGLLPEPPKLEELAKGFEEVWKVGVSPSSTFLESLAAGFTSQLTLGLWQLGGEAQRRVAAGLHSFLDILASKAPKMPWVLRLTDPLGVQSMAAAAFGVDYNRLFRAGVGTALALHDRSLLRVEEKAELAALASSIAPHVPAYVFGSALGTGFAAALQTYALQKAAELPGGKVKLGETTLKFENLAERAKFEAKVHLPEKVGGKLGDILVKAPEGWQKLGEKPLAPGTYEARVGKLVPHAPTQLDVIAQRVKVPEGEAGRLYVGYEGWKPLPRDVNLDLLKLKPGEVGYIPTREGLRVPVTEGRWGAFGARLEGEAFRAQWLFGVGSERGSAFKWGFMEKPMRVSPPQAEAAAIRLTVDLEKLLTHAKVGGGLPARPALLLQEGAEAVPLALRPTLPIKMAPEPALKPQLFTPPAAVPKPVVKPVVPISPHAERERRSEEPDLKPRLPLWLNENFEPKIHVKPEPPGIGEKPRIGLGVVQPPFQSFSVKPEVKAAERVSVGTDLVPKLVELQVEAVQPKTAPRTSVKEAVEKPPPGKVTVPTPPLLPPLPNLPSAVRAPPRSGELRSPFSYKWFYLEKMTRNLMNVAVAKSVKSVKAALKSLKPPAPKGEGKRSRGRRGRK